MPRTRDYGIPLGIVMLGLDSAEAILKLRALASNGDHGDAYWTYHQEQERLRVHNTRYWNNIIPT